MRTPLPRFHIPMSPGNGGPSFLEFADSRVQTTKDRRSITYLKLILDIIVAL